MANLKQIPKIGVIVIIVVFVFLFMVIYPILNQFRHLSMRLFCGHNLKDMANALNVYAFDYRDEYPVQSAGTHTWGATTTGWDDPEKDWDTSTGTLTVASSLFLLAREADMGVKSFICTASDQQTLVNKTDFDVVELWDFGPKPTEHQSYSYQFPYGKFPADGTTNIGNAIMADRNPWFDKTLIPTDIENETGKTFVDKVSVIDLVVSAERWKRQIGNSGSHEREGQNVLFNDGHVGFRRRPDGGTRYDNIYTIGGETQEENRRGIAPTSEEIDSVDEFDSLLVNDR